MIWTPMLNFASFCLFHGTGWQAFLRFGTLVAQMWLRGSQGHHFPSYVGYDIPGMSVPDNRGSLCENRRKLRKSTPMDKWCFWKRIPWSKGGNVKIDINGTILKWNWSSHLEELPCLSCFWTFKLGQPTHIPWHQEWEFPVDRTDKSEMLPSDHFTWPVNEVQIWNLLKRTYLIFLFYFIKNYDSLFCNTDAIWVFN